MKAVLLFLLFPLLAFALVPEETPECKVLYDKANIRWIELQPLIKTKIASKIAWELIGAYLDAASLTLSKCETDRALNFKFIRELKQGMKRADKLRNTFKVQTYEAMVAKARREGKCTIIYRSYKN